MEINTEDGPCKLLFVSRQNLPIIVAAMAPDMVLVPRAVFAKIATEMLEVVEAVAKV